MQTTAPRPLSILTCQNGMRAATIIALQAALHVASRSRWVSCTTAFVLRLRHPTWRRTHVLAKKQA